MTAPAQSLQHRCEQMLSELDLPTPFDLDVLLAQLSPLRRRPLRLLPLLPGLRDDPSGLWVPLEDEDVVFAESSVSDWYRDHVILHEVGHMLWQHRGTIRDVTDWLGQYGVETSQPTRTEMRCSVRDRDKEREAEMVALLIESRIAPRTRSIPGSTSPPAEIAAVLNRLALALGATAAAAGG